MAAALCAGSAAFAFDENHLMKFKATKECPKCDLSGVIWFNAYLSGANLQEANLNGAILSGASLDGADLQNANLGGGPT